MAPAPVRIGTCSWADEALTKHWYPKEVKSAEERLRYYAERFSTVEVDSTYYRLPDEAMLLQFPSYVVYKDVSLDYLRWAVEQLDGDRALVEFRHRSWLDEENRADTLAFLEKLRAANVCVDAPRTEAKNLVPTVVAATSPLAYARMHGRNAATWNARGGSASDRFDYLYPDDELREWVEPLRELGKKADEVYVLFNNNRWSRTARGELAAQAPLNASALRGILDQEGVPTA